MRKRDKKNMSKLQKKEISLNNKKNKYLVLDTETIHSGKAQDNEVIAIKDIIEISWKVLDCDGIEIIGSKKGFIVQEFWENKYYLLSDNCEKLKTGAIKTKKNYAINKLVKWEKALANNTLQEKSWVDIMKALNHDLKNYQITLFSAYNIMFDRCAIACTNQILGNKGFTTLWQKDFIDIMEMIKVIAKDSNFKLWSDNHKSKTAKGNYKVSAQAVYRYLTNNSVELEINIPDSSKSWSETHLAIEDIDCEAVIIQGALSLARRKRDIKVNINCYGGWKALNSIIKGIDKPLNKKEQKVIQLSLLKDNNK